MLDVHVQPCGAFLVRPSFVCGAAGESRPQCYFISRSTVETRDSPFRILYYGALFLREYGRVKIDFTVHSESSASPPPP